MKLRPLLPAAQQRHAGIADRLHAGDATQATLEVAIKHVYAGPFVAGKLGINSEIQDVAGIKTGVNVPQILKRPDHQSRTDKHDHRQADLPNKLQSNQPLIEFGNTKGNRLGFNRRPERKRAGYPVCKS